MQSADLGANKNNGEYENDSEKKIEIDNNDDEGKQEQEQDCSSTESSLESSQDIFVILQQRLAELASKIETALNNVNEENKQICAHIDVLKTGAAQIVQK